MSPDGLSWDMRPACICVHWAQVMGQRDPQSGHQQPPPQQARPVLDSAAITQSGELRLSRNATADTSPRQSHIRRFGGGAIGSGSRASHGGITGRSRRPRRGRRAARAPPSMPTKAPGEIAHEHKLPWVGWRMEVKGDQLLVM